MRSVIAIGFLSFIAITSIALFFGALCIWLVTAAFDRRLVILHLYSSFWASIYVWLMPAWHITRLGKQNIDWQRTYIVISNHQSLLDILVAFSLFFPFKWVSKAEIFRVPFIGWNMVLNRYIKLFRGDKKSISQMMHDCEQHLTQGSSVYIFPEGTRSQTGQLKDFKLGAFILAKKLKLPILPIVINGTTDALPKHSLSFHGHHHITIEVLPAVEPESFEHVSAEALATRMQNLIGQRVSELTMSQKSPTSNTHTPA